MFKRVLWLAAPAIAIFSSCEPSAPSHCTRLDEQCSYMYWKLLTLVSTHPCLHMRWVLHFCSGPFVMPVDIANAFFSPWRTTDLFFYVAFVEKICSRSCQDQTSRRYHFWRFLLARCPQMQPSWQTMIAETRKAFTHVLQFEMHRIFWIFPLDD